jgi:hypothetical protein
VPASPHALAGYAGGAAAHGAANRGPAYHGPACHGPPHYDATTYADAPTHVSRFNNRDRGRRCIQCRRSERDRVRLGTGEHQSKRSNCNAGEHEFRCHLRGSFRAISKSVHMPSLTRCSENVLDLNHFTSAAITLFSKFVEGKSGRTDERVTLACGIATAGN